MCVASMIGTHYAEKFPQQYPGWGQGIPPSIDTITRAEFTRQLDSLRKDIEELKALLIRAFKYDEETNQRHCETDEKYAILKLFAKSVGIDLEEFMKEHADKL